MNAMIFVLKGVTVQWRNSNMVKHPHCAQAVRVMNDSPARYSRLPGRQKLETSENGCLVVIKSVEIWQGGVCRD